MTSPSPDDSMRSPVVPHQPCTCCHLTCKRCNAVILQRRVCHLLVHRPSGFSIPKLATNVPSIIWSCLMVCMYEDVCQHAYGYLCPCAVPNNCGNAMPACLCRLMPLLLVMLFSSVSPEQCCSSLLGSLLLERCCMHCASGCVCFTSCLTTHKLLDYTTMPAAFLQHITLTRAMCSCTTREHNGSWCGSTSAPV